jgi:hypothetical protein
MIASQRENSPLLLSYCTATGQGVPAQADQLSTSALELISEITRQADEEHAATLERNRAQLETLVADGGAAAEGLKQKVLATIQDLKEGLLERETEVRLHGLPGHPLHAPRSPQAGTQLTHACGNQHLCCGAARPASRLHGRAGAKCHRSMHDFITAMKGPQRG